MKNNILIVDDNFEIIEELSGLLIASLGQLILTKAGSGNEAIGILKTGKHFDFIVSDYNMPDGNGVDLLLFLKTNGLNTPIILFSAESDIEIPDVGAHFLGVIDKTRTGDLIRKTLDVVGIKVEKSYELTTLSGLERKN